MHQVGHFARREIFFKDELEVTICWNGSSGLHVPERIATLMPRYKLQYKTSDLKALDSKNILYMFVTWAIMTV